MSLSCRKKLAYIYQAKVKKNDSHYHCIWGKFEPPTVTAALSAPNSILNSPYSRLNVCKIVCWLWEGFLSKLDHSATTSANGAESDSWSGDQNHSELESSFEERELARNSSTSELESDGDGNRSPQEFGREVTEVEDQVLQNVGNVEAKPVRFQQQQLDDETHALQLELGNMLDAVQETESKMGEMSALNHLMSTHVLQQAQQIEHLYEQGVEATTNVELGNKELSQAIQRNSSSRTFLLLFLFVLTFSVLFLDWYS